MSTLRASRSRLGRSHLENFDASLTTYLPTAASSVQDIRPLHLQLGTGLYGSIRAVAAFPWMISGNPMPSSGVANFGGVRLDTGVNAPLAMDITLSATVPFTIGRTFNPRQDTSAPAERNSDGYMRTARRNIR